MEEPTEKDTENAEDAIEEIERRKDSDAVDLVKYCAQEGISVEKVISTSRLPEVISARKRIAKAMDADGISRKTIAVELRIGGSTLWNYLHKERCAAEKPGVSFPVIELDFTGREDLLEKIRDIAEDRLREPESQVLWWLINTDFDKLLKGGLVGD